MNKPTIYITRKIPAALLKPYEQSFHFRMWSEEEVPISTERLRQEIQQVDGVVCLLTEQITEEVLTQANRLKIIANMAVGYDNIDVEKAKERNIIVTNTPDVLTETTADLAFGLLISTARQIVMATKAIQENQWGKWSPFQFAGVDVHGKTLGIVGMGRIGAAVARRAAGFNMNVLYYNRSRAYELEEEVNASYVTFDGLLAKADYVLSAVPLTEETKDLFDKAAFAKMKNSAIFINISRGGVVDEAALYEALQNGTIQAAGLDVYQNEPIHASHPLVALDNTVCLPHIGSATVETREAMIKLCLDNIAAYFTTGYPISSV
ncbi:MULTISPECIES: D-glycerate dehydrogenase [unclassified Virgibacillus]|uniref:2-hydroxyacid dehydrogenase n=1 Tax=unclassified Virgibacillus TaxID=2620237 RepID=UPI0024DEB35D|nr:D-glycerate dehydrogenase [Virgibacillus sp. LDC-1]